MEEIPKYHQLAKDAGNKLRAYILSISSGATGILFLFLVKSENNLNILDKCLLSVSLLCFVSTVCICLYELNIDARRFFLLAKELKKPEKEQSWETNKKFKKKRFFLIYVSYFTLFIAILLISTYSLKNIMNG